MAIVLVFFFWPAAQALRQSVMMEDAFGTSSQFVGLENFQRLFADETYLASFRTTAIFSVLVAGLGIGIALLIGGAVVTETVFNIPGLGRLVVDAILRRDYPIIQGLILVFSFTYIIINMLIDIAYTMLDPRIRY